MNLITALKQLQANPHQKNLNLGACGVTNHDLDRIVTMLNNTPSVVGLSLHRTSRVMPFADELNWSQLAARGTENSFSGSWLEKLSQLRHIQFLDVSDNYVGKEGVKALSKMPKLRKLWVLKCSIPASAAKHFLEFRHLEFLHDAYNDSNDAIQKEIGQHLKTNRYNNASSSERAALKHKELQNQAIDAALNGNVSILRELLPKLPKGANDVEGDDNLLLCAASAGHADAVKYLLNCGANVEACDPNVKKTPLFEAAENGHTKVVRILLQHIANMRGEFDFNQEDAISIAIFKFESLFRKVLKQCKHLLATNLQDKTLQLISYLDMDLGTELIQMTTNGVVEEVFEQPKRRWAALGEHPHKHDILTLMADICAGMMNLPADTIMAAKDLATFRQWHEIISGLAYKLRIAKGLEIQDNSDSHVDLSINTNAMFVTTPHFNHNINNHRLTDIELQAIVDLINIKIKEGKIETINWEDYPSLFIVQYRGHHFYTNHFNKAQKENCLHSNYLNRGVFASAAFEMANSKPIEVQLTRESELNRNAKMLRETVDDMATSGSVKGDWNRSRVFANKRDLLQQRYTNSMSGFKQDLANANTVIGDAFRPLGVKNSLPFVSTADSPIHALRYAYGLKPDKTLKGKELKPTFIRDGRDEYLGILFAYVFPVAKWQQVNPHHVPSMHNSGSVNIGPRILPELETSFVGSIYQEFNWLQYGVSIPDFSNYDIQYLTKYGLDEKAFKRYKEKLKDEDGVQEVLSSLAKLQEKNIFSMVQEEMIRRGGYVVYVNMNGQLQITPPYIKKKETVGSPSPLIFSDEITRSDKKRTECDAFGPKLGSESDVDKRANKMGRYGPNI